MRVVMPYVTLTDRCRDKLPAGSELIDVSHNDLSYARAVKQIWSEGISFCLIEHDIEIHDRVLFEFTFCPEDWCSFEYVGAGGHTFSALGCVRFSAGLLKQWPDLIRDDVIWRRLDCSVKNELLRHGYRECIHSPPVMHHHVYGSNPGRCGCGDQHD